MLTALEVKPAAVLIGEAEREAALALLKSPDLLARIAGDFGRCGIVGERSNALVGYLAAISRKLDRPLALLIQSTSAAGKSSPTRTPMSPKPCNKHWRARASVFSWVPRRPASRRSRVESP